MSALKYKIWKLVPVLVFLFSTVSLSAQDADIYSLWPFSGTDNISLSAARSTQKTSRFWQEKIFANGKELQLEISLVEEPLAEIRKKYAGLFQGRKDVFMGGNSNSILLQEVQKDGSLKRQYFLELSGIHPVLLFEMVLPPGKGHFTAEDWPSELPLLHGADDLTCMKFPAREAVYGAYNMKGKMMPQVLGEVTDQLVSMGWEKVSREADHVFEGTGEVFLKDNGTQLMILGLVSHNGGEDVRVSMYTRPIRKGEQK